MINNNEEKKEYVVPQMTIVEMESVDVLFCSSDYASCKDDVDLD